MKISYIIPMTRQTGIRLIDGNCAQRYLSNTIESVINQSIDDWELIVVIEKSYLKKVTAILDQVIASSIALSGLSQNVIKKKISFKLSNSKNSAAACNVGLQNSKGKFICIIQAGDILASYASYALYECLIKNPNVQFIYSDHDYIDLNGIRFNPFSKPDLSLDLLYCQNYVQNLVAINRTLIKKLGGYETKYFAAYDYAINLKAIGRLLQLQSGKSLKHPKDQSIKHLSQILCHRRVNLKINPKSKKINDVRPNTNDETIQSKQGLSIIKSFFKSQGKSVTVKQIKPNLYRPIWKIPKPNPLVTLIIPNRDNYQTLRTCVESILQNTTYRNFEILIVDNQSKETSTLNYMKRLENEYSNVKTIKYNKPFNYSAINNFAAKKAKGEILGLINNDTEVITPTWLTEMVSHAIRPEVGCVGAMLYYPDRIIQHAGVHVTINGALDHAFKGFPNTPENDYFNYLKSNTNPIAVTAAALLVRKDLFLKVGGFDEKNLKIAFNDVDLCLKLRDISKLNVQLSHVELIHHESKSRASDGLNSKYMRNEKELIYLRCKWSHFFKAITHGAQAHVAHRKHF